MFLICHQLVMEFRPGRQDLKVDITALKGNNRDPRYLVLCNITVPAFMVYNRESRREALQNIRNLIDRDFGRENRVVYQLSGSYTLRHTRLANITRHWTGSFFAHLNSPAQITDFHTFHVENFIQIADAAMQDVDTKLTYTLAIDTEWAFDSLTSVIINIQAKVDPRDPLLRRRNLISATSKKNHVTFLVPWQQQQP
jgi:hypothetical protein